MANTRPETVSEAHGIARNAAFLLFAKLITTTLGFYLVIFLTRKLGAAHFGIYTLGLYYASFFSLLGDLGLNNLLTREIARNRSYAGEIIGNVLVIKVALNIIALIAGIVFVFILGYSAEARPVLFVLLSGTLLVGSFISIFIHTCEGFEQMQHITIIESLRKTIDLLVCLSLLSLGYGIFEMSVGLVAGQILVLLVIWLLFRHAFGVAPRPALTWTGALSLIPQALPYGLLLVFYGVIQSTDSIMLATLRTEEEVGWYGVILRVINILSLIPLMCASAMFPTTARLYETDREQTVTIVRGLLRLMTFLALPIAVGVTLESPAIIRFLFTDAFLPAASPFKIITWSTGLYFLTIPLVLFLSAIGRQHYVTATLGAAALSNVLFNFILIPVWGMNGAATATVIAEILILTFCALETRKHIQKPGIVRHLVQSVIGCVAMTLVIWPLQGFHVLPVTGLGALVYIGVLFLIGALNRHDLKDIYRIIKRN